MRKNRFWQTFPAAALAITFALVTTAFASEKILYAFAGGTGGGNPTTGLVSDTAGNLYGMTSVGGNVESVCSLGCGVIFKLTPTNSGPWRETVLYSFTGGADGWSPAGLAIDAAGNLYGVNQLGGKPTVGTKICMTFGCGTLFRLSHNINGGWTFHLLHAFTGESDGINPGSVTLDASGNVFVTAFPGVQTSSGTIFEMVGGTQGTVIYNFIGTANGDEPDGPGVFDAAGNLYGTGAGGGANDLGVVYELTPSSSGQWTESVLHSFTGGNDGDLPQGNLAFDSSGNLFGSAGQNGAGKNGVIFELSPNSGGQWTETTIYAFTGGSDGDTPMGVVRDADGNLFGTTGGSGDATCRCGTVFELTPSTGGWSEITLHDFTGQHDGKYPTSSAVLLDANGNLYGATIDGGIGSCTFALGCGVVYELPGVGAAVK
jgi:uncharacterized repeat protein (TIGR03803 family)